MVISDPTFSKKMMNPDIKEIEAVTLHIPAHPPSVWGGVKKSV